MAYAIMRSDRYRSFVFTVPSGHTKVIGTLYLVNDTWAVCFSSEDNSAGGEAVGDSIAAGKECVFIYNCDKINVLKAAGTAWAVGEKIYVAPATKACDTTLAGAYTTCIGICTQAATSAAVVGEIDLKGDSMTDQT